MLISPAVQEDAEAAKSQIRCSSLVCLESPRHRARIETTSIMLRQICCSLFFAVLFALCAGAQDANYKIVFRSREYKAVGRSYPQSWSMTLPDRQKAPHTEGACTPREVRSE